MLAAENKPAPRQLTDEQRKEAEAWMNQKLESIPTSRFAPIFLRHFSAMIELTILESVLKKLKSFVRFLSKLSPTEYLNWMHQAYSQVIGSKFENAASPTAKDEVKAVEIRKLPQAARQAPAKKRRTEKTPY